MTVRIQTPTESMVVHYPEAVKFQDLQQNAFWTANEVNLEKDIQPLLTEMDEAEKHGVLTVLKLFTLYELRADEFWGDVIKNMFPRPEIQGMASMFSAMEKSVHLRVYDKLNKLLNVSDDEFYNSYQDSPSMKARMEYLDKKLNTGTDLEKIAAFSFAEGAVLFSSFAYLMSFRANGSNKLPNIGLAVKFSARDEDCVDGGTEVLTPSGWVKIQDYNTDTTLAQYDTKTGGVSFVNPSRKVEKHFEGEMLSFKDGKGNFDQLVTPNHRVVFKTVDKPNYSFKEAHKFKPHCGNFIPIAGYIEGDSVLSMEDRLRIAIQADGHVSKRYDGSRCGTFPVSFSLSKERKLTRLKWLLSDLGIAYTEKDIGLSTEKSKPRKEIKFNLDIGKFEQDTLKDMSWVNLSDVSSQWCSSFLDELVLWDGHVTENKPQWSTYFSSTNKDVVDLVQSIGALCGRNVNTSIQVDNRSDSYRDVHRAYISTKSEKRCGAIKKSNRPFNGKVYCVTVPTGAFLIRRNGCVSVTGNCHNQGASWLFQTLKFELEQEGYDSSYLEQSIVDMAHAIQEHEYEIIDEIFAKAPNGKMSNITDVQMRHFVDSRINKVLKRLGFKPIFKVTYNPIAEWFDKVVESYQSVDFFAGQGSSYRRGWNKEEFTWNNG